MIRIPKPNQDLASHGRNEYKIVGALVDLLLNFPNEESWEYRNNSEVYPVDESSRNAATQFTDRGWYVRVYCCAGRYELIEISGKPFGLDPSANYTHYKPDLEEVPA